MSEEMNDRYVIEILADRVLVLDTANHDEIAAGYFSADRLLLAEQYAARLNARHEDGHADPAAFLSKTLPAYALRQRRESQLAQVIEIESRLVAELAEVAGRLSQATDLRRRLEDSLTALSSTETPEQSSPVVAEGEAILEALERSWKPMFKPGPY